jgi:hypothetical protein
MVNSLAFFDVAKGIALLSIDLHFLKPDNSSLWRILKETM